MKIIDFFKNKYIINFIFSIFVYILFCYKLDIMFYNIISFFIFVIIYYFFINNDIHFNNRKEKFVILGLATIYSLIMASGDLLNNFKNDININFFDNFLSIKNLFSILAYLIFFGKILCLIFNVCQKHENKIINSNSRKYTIKTIFLFVFIIVICWLPYFLSHFPAILSPDSLSQITLINENFLNISDKHPLIHSIIISIPFNVGKILFNNMNIAVAFVSCFQMLVMAFIYAYVLLFLLKRNVNKIIILMFLLYYALSPLHAFYSITIWKDILFSGVFVLLLTELIKLIENKNVLQFKQFIPFIFISILLIFLRHNAVYMYAILFVSSFLYFKNVRKKIVFVFLIIFMTFVVVKGPIFTIMNVEKSRSVESLAIPIQQVSRMIAKDVKLSSYQAKKINDVIPIDDIKKNYNFVSVDNIKFNKHFNINVLNNNKSQYFKLWLELVIQNPHIAIESYLYSTYGYWYPNVEYWSVYGGIDSNELGIYHEPKSNLFVQKIIYSIKNKNLPLLFCQWSVGLCVFVIILSASIAMLKKDFKSLYFYVPIFGIWLSLMVATPVYAELRYIYCAYTSLPLLLIYPYLNKTKE